jgi:hypothetical protein
MLLTNSNEPMWQSMLAHPDPDMPPRVSNVKVISKK